MSKNLTESEREAVDAVTSAEKIPAEDLGGSVEMGELLTDSDLVYSRFIKKEGDLFYHIFRGQKIPDRYWGQGEFGLTLLEVAEKSWPMDKPHIEFAAESVRPEAKEDDPTKESKYPSCFYGSYFVCIPSIDNRPLAPKADRIRVMIDELESQLVQQVPKWMKENGNGSS